VQSASKSGGDILIIGGEGREGGERKGYEERLLDGRGQTIQVRVQDHGLGCRWLTFLSVVWVIMLYYFLRKREGGREGDCHTSETQTLRSVANEMRNVYVFEYVLSNQNCLPRCTRLQEAMNLKSQTRNALDNDEEEQLEHQGTIREVYNGTANDESWRLEVCMCA
jgi:hypothetical protein